MGKVFQDLTSKVKNLVQITFENPGKVIKRNSKLGCSNCPLDKDRFVRQK